MAYWSAVDILKQLSGELGIPVQTTVVSASNPQGSQLLAALNSAGNELLLYYPWAQFTKEWAFNTVAATDSYDMPNDWRYFRDQTQWDRTNHWPLMGPKSPQEWAWLKGGLVASFPRTRYRVVGNKFIIFPTPTSGPAFASFNLAMEYVSKNWVDKGAGAYTDMVTADGDICMFDPWLLIKYVRLKFYQLKGFDTKAAESEFLRVYEALTGKDVGAPVLSLTPQLSPLFIGAQSIPDGNWNVTP